MADLLIHANAAATAARAAGRHRLDDAELAEISAWYRGAVAKGITGNQAERDVRPVKVQQRSSGGCWRTLDGLADFAIVHSYLSTAAKWGLSKLDALRQLFTTGPWLPPATAPP
jgi:transposase